MAGDAGRSKVFGAEEFEVVGQVAEAGPEVIGEAGAGDPAGEAVEVAAVGQQGVGGQAALGLDVVAEGLHVVGQGGEVGGAVGGMANPFDAGIHEIIGARRTSRQGDKETRRQGERIKRQAIPFLLVSLSPCLLVCYFLGKILPKNSFISSHDFSSASLL